LAQHREKVLVLKLLFITGALLFCVTLRGNAQQATDVDLQPKQTPATASTTPAGPMNVPELAQLDEIFKQTSVGKEGDEQRLRIEWRQLKNQVMNEPDLVATKHAAEAARTDLKKREYLRKYYKLYFAKVRLLPMSPEMKQRIEGMETGALGSTAQSRVRPSPSPSASPPN
jgi:hypothetical protein